MFHVLLIWTSLKDVVRERERKLEAIPSASSRYHQRERERERERKKNSGCGSFVVAYFQPAQYFHRPFTVIHSLHANSYTLAKTILIVFPISHGARRAVTLRARLPVIGVDCAVLLSV